MFAIALLAMIVVVGQNQQLTMAAVDETYSHHSWNLLF